MSVMRVRYRVRQFWHALWARPSPASLTAAREVLNPRQMALFAQMIPSEQAHAVQVLHTLQRRCAEQSPPPPPDLWVAALLHDVGKVRYPLRVWERVLIVLGKALFPRQAKAWGARPPTGLARPFVVAAQHPVWGAELSAVCGTTPLALALIRRHQTPVSGNGQSEEDRLLKMLQIADDQN